MKTAADPIQPADKPDRLLADWAAAGGRGRTVSVQPPYPLRDESGRARYLAELTGRVAGWDQPLQIWHGPPPAVDDGRPRNGTAGRSGVGEAEALTRQLAATSHARTTFLIPRADQRAGTGVDADQRAADGSSNSDGVGREARDHVQVGEQVAAVWVLTGWPAAMRPDWAAPLTGLVHHVAMHTRPVDPTSAQRLLRRRLAALASTRLLDERSGRLDDPTLTVAVQAAADLREGLARGTTRLLHAQLLLVLLADDPGALRLAGRMLRDTARALLAEVAPLTFQHRPGYAAARPGAGALRWPWRLLDAASVAATVPLPVGPPLPRRKPNPRNPTPTLLGVDPASGVPLLLDRWTAHNPTRLVVGTSGAGKSYAAKLELLRQRSAGVRAVVIDPEGEFGALAHTLGGLHLAVGEEAVGLDPVGLATRPTIPAAEGLSVLTSWAAALLAQPLSAVDVALLDRALAVLRADLPSRRHPTDPTVTAGKAGADSKAGASAGDLLAVITDLADHPPFTGADLPARLAPAAGGTVADLFAPNPALADPPGIVCFDLRDVPGRVRPAVMATILAWTWAQTVSPPVATPTLLVIDEAHLLLDDPPAAELLAQFARRARKYAVGLDVVTQRLSDFLTHPAGQAVLANAATKLLLGCEDHERAAVATGLGLTAAETGWLTPGTHGRGLLISSELRSPVRIVAGPAEHQLASSPPRR